MLRHKKPNPLSYFKLRRVKYLSPQFEVFDYGNGSNKHITKIDDWISTNLSGRYYLDRHVTLDSNGRIIYTIKIGFENKKELSLFLLLCPYVTK